MKRLTLKDLAQSLDLTQSTVSRALNGYADISPSTVERVQKTARELGYKPNHNARRLATGVAEAVAFVIPQNHSSLAEPFVSQLLQGLDEALANRGWDLLVTHSMAAEDDASAIQRLINSDRVSGVVVSRPFRNDARITLLQQARFPFVVHGRSEHSDQYAWYDIDNEQAFEAAVNHLSSLGHTRISFIGAPLYFNFAYQRLQGYRSGLRQAGIDHDETLVRTTELNDDAAERAALNILNSKNPPTAFLCASDTQAFGVLAAIRSRGFIPGKHISVIGYDGLKMGQHTNPPLSTMSQPLAQSGYELGCMLMAIIDGDDPKKHQVLKRAKLLVRGSDGPLWTQHNH